MAAKKEPPKRRGKASKGEDGKAGFAPGDAAPPKAFNAEAVADRLDLWWEDGDSSGFILKAGGAWASWSEKKITVLLREQFVRVKKREGEQTSEVERVFNWTMENRRLDMVTPAIAGYPSGIHDLQGLRVLVKRSPRLVEPAEGPWDMVRALIEGKLDLRDEEGHGIDQTDFFHGWMQTAVRSLYLGGPGNHLQGQAAIFAGRAGTGKSRLQNQLITPLLGGRSADPCQYLSGRTDFNGDMMGAEHLMMEDPASKTKTADRVEFGERVKGLVANDWHRLHAKREDAFAVAPFFRVTISINDDPDKMRILPLLTPDMKDKLHLFLVSEAALPMPTKEPEERKAFRERIASELPAYAWWLLNVYQIPEELKDQRMGVRYWHHPRLAMELFDDTPAAELLQIIDAAVFEHEAEKVSRRLWDLRSSAHPDNVGKCWEGTALELESILLNTTDWRCSVEREAKKLILHNKVDRLMGRLAEDEPRRVSQHRVKHQRRWVVSKGE